jgi:hypothetical protein
MNMDMRIQVFQDVTLCHQVIGSACFEGCSVFVFEV